MLLQVVNNECFDWLIHLFDFSLNENNVLQERIRYENPHKAFTFRMHGYESVVGPVKGMYNQAVCNNKPRGHSLLTESRPNFITILALGTLLFHHSWFLQYNIITTARFATHEIVYYSEALQHSLVLSSLLPFKSDHELQDATGGGIMSGFKLAILFATFTLLGFNWKAIYHFGWRLICRLHSRCVPASRTFST